MRAEGRTPFEKAVALAYGSRVGLGGTPHHVGGQEGPAETAYLGVFRRDRLFAVGLFDEGIKRGQDWELNRRLRDHGRHGLVHAGARRHLPAAPEPEASGPAVRRHRPLARRTGTPVPGRQRPALLRAAADGRWPSPSGSSPGSSASSGRRSAAPLAWAMTRVRGPGGLPALRRRRCPRGVAAIGAGDTGVAARRPAVHPLRLGRRLHPRVPDTDLRADHAHGTVTDMADDDLGNGGGPDPRDGRGSPDRPRSPNCGRWPSRTRSGRAPTPSTGRPRSTCATSRRT